MVNLLVFLFVHRNMWRSHIGKNGIIKMRQKGEKSHMTMNRKAAVKGSFVLRSIEELVPDNHLVRKLEKAIDWDFIYEEVEGLYSNTGRRSIDPVVLFKMIMINYQFGYNSMRKTCREIEVNVAYRWFLGISFEEKVPDYSTWSQNYIRRYGESEVFEKIFNRIIEEGINKHYIKPETVYGDSTHQKAFANKRKSVSKEVEVTRKKYEKELLEEINEDRKQLGKKPFEHLRSTEIEFDENGDEIEIVEKKTIKSSTTDPEAGDYHKGEHEECFAYSHQTFCDRNGFVLEVKTVPGNIHDSVSFFEAYEELNQKYEGIKNVCLDAGYNTPMIAREISDNKQKAILPYHRPNTREGYFKKSEFEYNKEHDFYVCPTGVVLEHRTTNREGYKEYKSSNCEGCPLKDKCTKSKAKTIIRHVWESYREEADQYRHTEKWKEIYPQRKQTIERVFADTKENNCLRFTRLKGLKKNQHQVMLIFMVHNLKKIALWNDKNERLGSVCMV